MLTLKQCFDDILKHPNKWNYYSESYRNVDSQEFINGSKEEIKKYLKIGGKLDNYTQPMIEELEELDSKRLEHIVALFLLGVWVYDQNKKIKRHLDRFRRVDKSHSLDTSFIYYWFLTCFYHDLGYVYEIKDKHESIDKLIANLEGNLSVPPSNNARGIPMPIRKLVAKYFNYRYTYSDCIDHGIIGGMLFYDNRVKSYKKLKKRYKKDEFCDEKGLLWSKDILNRIQCPIAWTIIAHNIWFVSDGTESSDLYREYGLEDLIVDNPIIKLHEHPLLTILSVVDTIDPIKYFSKKYPQCGNNFILKNVLLESNDDEIKINLSEELQNYRKEYFQNIKNMEQWICCDVEISSEGLVVKF